MNTAISRMQFLRGDFAGKDTPIRPPWSAVEPRFVDLCTRCGDCIPRCPTGIIIKGRGGYPVIDFSHGECLFCGDCVTACSTDALGSTDTRPAWHVHAAIDNSRCIALKDVECRSCQDPCEARAITMVPRLGGVSIPVLHTGTCTGCGACFNVCPSQAISMNNQPLRRTV